MKKILVITLHVLIMTLAYTSPFWLDYKLMIAGIILYYIQIWIFGGCILTFAQFGKWDETFTGRGIIFLGNKVGMKFKKESVKRFLDILPAVFLIIAIIYQIVLRIHVLVEL